ncbi:craniofacial development protein 2-like [Corticium candelabrum]|uniref:craniofacial development protein 2-like n=1 Tax=Corticium candelabrum TaxID=121492 RepID=UPI002E25C2F1|nr:craniofacial development protein 2-like [Corticium candelabrum]
MVKNSCKSSLHYPSTVILSSSIHRKRKEINDVMWKKNQLLKFGVWNVRTLKGVGRTDLLAKELITTDITLCGITETHLPGAGIIDLYKDSCNRLLFSGPPALASMGVGLVVRHNVMKSLKSFDPISLRILRADFVTDKGILNVIVGYAPTEIFEEIVKDEFYQQLHVAMHKTGSLVVVLGDFNARLGTVVSKVVGQFDLSQSTSDNGVRLIEFCQAHNLEITNIFFQNKNIHTATWYPPNPKLQPSLKDCVLVKQSVQKMVHDTRVRRGPNLTVTTNLFVVRWYAFTSHVGKDE